MIKNLPLFSLILLALCLQNALGDWPQWRGANQDGKSTETGLLKKWPAEGPPIAWRMEGVGTGFSSVSIADGLIVTMGDLEDGSYVMALNERDGKLKWKTRVGEAGGHKGYPGPRSTPTIEGGQVFALNQYADLVSLDVKSGKLLWTVNLSDDFAGKMMSGWKYSESPLVDGDKVIITPGGKGGAVMALNRKDGKELWRSKEWVDPAGYSTVIIEMIHGKRQYVQLTGQHVAGLDPDSGKVIWKAARQGKTAVITTPVVQDDVVFVTSAYGIGCHAFRIHKDGSTEQIYESKEVANHHGGVVLVDGYVYGSSGRHFTCIDIKSGELKYKDRSVGKGATTFAEGHLYLRSETGPVALIKATPEGLKEVSRFDQPDRSKRKSWAHPVIANGKLYLRDQELLLCYDIKS